MAAMLSSMRPMKESTISSAEMSISTPRARSATIALRQVVLQRHGEPVVHVDLDRDQQAVADLEDRDLAPSRPVRGSVRLGAIDDDLSVRRSASASASASVALETTFSSTPRWTMVWAICGRMPLMMQSAPISRAAAIVLSRCCATSVSTVGTPVMSMMAISAPVSTIRSQQVLHDDLGARAVERADQRQGEDALPQLDHRCGEFQQLLLLAADHIFPRPGKAFDGVEAETVEQAGDVPGFARDLLRVGAELAAQQVEQRLLHREHEDGRFAGAEPLGGAGAGKILEQLAHSAPFRAGDVIDLAGRGALLELVEELPRQIGRGGIGAGVARIAAPPNRHPGAQQGVLVLFHQRGDRGIGHTILTLLRQQPSGAERFRQNCGDTADRGDARYRSVRHLPIDGDRRLRPPAVAAQPEPLARKLAIAGWLPTPPGRR